MAYPTTVLSKLTDNRPGSGPMDQVDTVQQFPFGTRQKFQDPAKYGEIECVYLKGVAALAKGDLVVFNSITGVTTRTVAASRGPAAVAMGIPTATQFGWFAIEGAVPLSSTASGGAGLAQAVTATAGRTTVSGAAAQKVSGLITLAAQDAPNVNFTDVQLQYPSMNGDT